MSNKVEYKAVYIIPELYFPKYPDPEGKVKPLDKDLNTVSDNGTEIKYVLMPLDYYRLIVNYKLEVDKTKIKYQTFRENIKK